MRLWPLVVCAGLLAPGLARADDSTTTDLALEAGSELDSNPRRETGTLSAAPAAVGRAGIRFSLGWRPAPRRAFRLSAVAAAKKFIGVDHVESEDVAVVAGDLRYDARAAHAPLVLSGRLAYYDAIERSNPVSEGFDHDFRTGDAALALTLLGESSQRATLLAGARAYQYKPDQRYDFLGEHAQLEWRRTWEPAEDTDEPTWELAAWYGLARRAYNDDARANTCPPGGEVPTECLVRQDADRVDLVHTGGAELTYTGERILSARYESTVILSNSYGESLARHRLELSATTETYWSIYVTVRAVVQYNQFFDPVLLTFDIGKPTIEDENRNSINLHATRDLGAHWALEGRYAFYSNEFATQALEFRRQTAYLGLIWRL